MPTLETVLTVAIGATLLAGLYYTGREIGRLSRFGRLARVVAVVVIAALPALLAAFGGDDHTTAFRLKVFAGVYAVYFLPAIFGAYRGIKTTAPT